ncbi:hypothetical protein LCGC14_3141490, partial [marine sediment metagenome]
GFNYLGPVDGHNTEELMEVITRARLNSEKVPFIHVITNKGQGFAPAEKDPVGYHQPSTPTPTTKTYSQVFCQTLAELMEADERIVAISAAMLEGTGLSAIKERFPKRVFDVGICEQHAVSMAAGMASGGLRPVVCIYSTFLQRAFDQILHDVCLNDLPVVFAVDRAGIVGQDGKTHHGLYDLAYMRLIPNMVVSVPRDENELRHLLFSALKQQHPFAIRYPRGGVEGVELEPLREIEVGKAEVVREGKDICLIAVGRLVHVALGAARELALCGIEAAVINLRFIKPLDPAVKESDNFEHVLVMEEATEIGGAMAAIRELVKTGGLHHIAVGDRFLEHG